MDVELEKILIELAPHHNTSLKLCNNLNNLKLIPVDLQISNIQIRTTESPVGSKLLARESVSPVKPSARDCRIADSETTKLMFQL